MLAMYLNMRASLLTQTSADIPEVALFVIKSTKKLEEKGKFNLIRVVFLYDITHEFFLFKKKKAHEFFR